MEPAPAPPSADAQLAMDQNIPGGPMSQPMARYGTELRKFQQQGETDGNDDRQDVEFEYEGGSPEFIEYYNTDKAYRDRLYEQYKKTEKNNPVSQDEFDRIFIESQRRNYELANFAETYNKNNNLKPGDDGYIDIKSESFDRGFRYRDEPDGKKVDHGVTKDLRDLILKYNEEMKDEEGFTALTIPTKDETYTFQQGYRGNLLAEAADQYKRKQEGKDYDEDFLASFFSTGVDDSDADKGVLNPYWNPGDPEEEKYFKGISKSDMRYGNTTLGQRTNVKGSKRFREIEVEPGCPDAEARKAECDAKPNHTWIPYNEEDGSGCLCSPDSPEPKKEKELPNADFWKQDLIKMNAIAQRDRDLFLPFQPEVENVDVDYVLEDPTRAIAAINEQANILNNANNAY